MWIVIISSCFKNAGFQGLITEGLDRMNIFCGSYRLVLLPGHVRSEDRLHGQSGSLLLPVAFLLHVHPPILLDDGGRLSATHELGQAEQSRDIHISANTYL